MEKLTQKRMSRGKRGRSDGRERIEIEERFVEAGSGDA